MKERLREIRKYALSREPTDDELLAAMNLAKAKGQKTEACSASEVVVIRGKRYRYHRGYWTRWAGYTTNPSIWPDDNDG